jgi:hypothetical protein
MTEDIWDNKSVYLTSFWGWSPETWGTVGFTSEARRNTIVREATDPFIAVIYVTKNAPNDEYDIWGKITGFYVVSHIEGHRNEFTAPHHHERNPEKWQYSLKALRAFNFLPEYRLDIDAFDPTIKTRAQAIAQWGEELPHDPVQRLKKIPYVEVPVYGGSSSVNDRIHVPLSGQHMVRSGPANRSGYVVAGEPVDTEKELYALRLEGDISAFLGEPADENKIFKVGLSLSPRTRLETFRKTMPEGAFNWSLHRSTRNDGYAPYPNFESAEKGECAMKEYLGREGRWLGSEFYAATSEHFEKAWCLGREAALCHSRSTEGAEL